MAEDPQAVAGKLEAVAEDRKPWPENRRGTLTASLTVRFVAAPALD
jgi:hypothetical protein